MQNGDGIFSLKSFIRGMVAVALVYGLLAGWLWFSADKMEIMRNDRLASKTVLVQWPDDGAAPEEEVSDEDGAAPVPVTVSALPADTPLLESGLAVVPVEGLYKDSPLGEVPAIRKDGLTAFKAYRRPFDRANTDKPIVSIAVVDIGLSDVASESALRSLPPEVSFALSPYAPSPDFWVNESRARGHEMWMTLPLEPADYPQTDPGPHSLLIGVPERENQSKLLWLLARANGYIGFIAGRYPEFMKSVLDMRPVIGSIYSHGLAFADSAENAGTIPATMAMGMDAAYAGIDVWIDEPATQESIRQALATLEQKARENGSAAGVIRPLPVSYQEVLRWIGTLNEKGLILAPLSAQTGM